MINASEILGHVRPKLSGVSRRIGFSVDPELEAAKVKRRQAWAIWRSKNVDRHRAYQVAYDREHRSERNARVARYAAAHPERRREQLRAAALRYWTKKRAKVLAGRSTVRSTA